MNSTDDRERPSGLETSRELVYAVPAGMVMFVHAIVALVGLGGVIIGISGLESTTTSLYRLLIPLAALVAAVAATALSAALWARRSWWILLVPACTVPCMLIAGFTYMYLTWSY